MIWTTALSYFYICACMTLKFCWKSFCNLCDWCWLLAHMVWDILFIFKLLSFWKLKLLVSWIIHVHFESIIKNTISLPCCLLFSLSSICLSSTQAAWRVSYKMGFWSAFIRDEWRRSIARQLLSIDNIEKIPLT